MTHQDPPECGACGASIAGSAAGATGPCSEECARQLEHIHRMEMEIERWWMEHEKETAEWMDELFDKDAWWNREQKKVEA